MWLLQAGVVRPDRVWNPDLARSRARANGSGGLPFSSPSPTCVKTALDSGWLAMALASPSCASLAPFGAFSAMRFGAFATSAPVLARANFDMHAERSEGI